MDKPQLLALQIDPMRYLFKAREFAINHVSGEMRERWQSQERGIFGDDYELEAEREEAKQPKSQRERD